ncbi:hypothetical protein [Streptomyces sp. NPDC002580]|uniref:hypothetical protein n=1 Tax=Streptomyces sp. NPDC002580 TaxID=3364653 RepID=UPI0036C7C999
MTPTSNGATGAPGARADIDAAQDVNSCGVRAALTGGRTFAGVRDRRVNESQNFVWTNLSTHPGHPLNTVTGVLPCAAAVNAHGGDDLIKFDVITGTGQVRETGCLAVTNTHPVTLNCDSTNNTPIPWTLVTNQPA